MGATRPHNPAARGELLGATARGKIEFLVASDLSVQRHKATITVRHRHLEPRTDLSQHLTIIQG